MTCGKECVKPKGDHFPASEIAKIFKSHYCLGKYQVTGICWLPLPAGNGDLLTPPRGHPGLGISPPSQGQRSSKTSPTSENLGWCVWQHLAMGWDDQLVFTRPWDLPPQSSIPRTLSPATSACGEKNSSNRKRQIRITWSLLCDVSPEHPRHAPRWRHLFNPTKTGAGREE